MLYLFGQLALSDSLYYHENYQADGCQPSARQWPDATRAAAVGRRLRRNRHLPQASRAAAGRGQC